MAVVGSPSPRAPLHVVQRDIPSSSSPDLHLVVSGASLTDNHRTRLSKYFKTIDYFPNLGEIDAEALKAADVLYGWGWGRRIQSFDQIPNLRFAQITAAGADEVIHYPMWKEDERAERVRMATVAGVHMVPISQYFIMTTLSLFHHMQEQVLISHNEKRWGSDEEIGGGRMFIQELRGKTVGVLGYGHIGRECARLSAAFGAKVLAATSNGQKKPQEGYAVPGTGDPDGSIPEAWYSTRDPESFATFLSKSDVVVLSLPSTPATRHILSTTTLAHLPSHAVVVNVGRGDTMDTDALLIALDSGKLGGAALDVADHEPLPVGHPLFGRKDVVITPHLSGRTVQYYERALDIFEENIQRWKDGKELWNQVDLRRGY